MTPPFTIGNEQVMNLNQPAIQECPLSFDKHIDKPVRIISTSASFSDQWGFVLRVIFRGKVDETEVPSDWIYLCWKPNGQKTPSFVVSPADENVPF